MNRQENGGDMEKSTYKIHCIGTIITDESNGIYRLEVNPEYQPALQGLESCSHCIVLWWADKHDNPKDRAESLVMDLPYAPGLQSGVFANRSQARPNPIGITACFLINVDHENGFVDLAYIDAFDGTPLLDIKPYLPMSDRIMDAEYPEWLKGFPESMEEAAAFFSDPENIELFS
jgi:tRNA-Thr(GGU) m(6)t(6)A37 methyltransferase TsaA